MEKIKRKSMLLKKIEANVRIKKVGEFKNEYGEEFIVYRTAKNFFITGDEFDWEGGNYIKAGLLPNSFTPIYFSTRLDDGINTFNFNMEEQLALNKILYKLLTKEEKDEQASKRKARH